MSQRTGGLPIPYFNDDLKTLRISFRKEELFPGVNPSSRIKPKAIMNVRPSITARKIYGTPRFVNWAITPPANVPVSIATPEAIAPLARTDSRVPLYFADFKPSTSHASVAPEKNVKPRPSSIETNAHAQNGPLVCHIKRYRIVDTKSVAEPSRYDARRPSVSAAIPVGNSNNTWPAVKKALAAKAWVMPRPASSRNRVLMPQMKDDAKVDSSVSAT